MNTLFIVDPDFPLVDFIRCLAELSRVAYWKRETDCGSDYGPHCVDCQHEPFCTPYFRITRQADALEKGEQ